MQFVNIENPAIPHRVIKLSPGDEIAIKEEFDYKIKIGKQYKNQPAFVSRIIYFQKKWWQFWKKKQIDYIIITWIG